MLNMGWVTENPSVAQISMDLFSDTLCKLLSANDSVRIDLGLKIQ